MESPDAQVEWYGNYVQDGCPNEMHIDLLTFGADGTVTGEGEDDIGTFSIDGNLSANGQVQFYKQYDDAHCVAYNGWVGSETITGKWALDDMQGDFTLKFDAEPWNGYFSMNGQKYPMKLKMFIGESGIFGMTKDSEGLYIIKGFYNRDTDVMVFCKAYLGKYNLRMEGNVFSDGKFYIVKGQWTLSTGETGDFELYREIPMDEMGNPAFYAPPPPPANFAPTFYGLPPQQIPPQYHQQPQFAPQFNPQFQQQYAQQYPGYPPQGAPPQGYPPQGYPPQGAPPPQGYPPQGYPPQGPPPGQMAEPFSESDFFDGDENDLQKVQFKLSQGRKISGKWIQTFLDVAQTPQVISGFCKTLTVNHIEDFQMDHLVTGIQECSLSECHKEIAITLYPLLTEDCGALAQAKLLDLFVFGNDKSEVQNALGI